MNIPYLHPSNKAGEGKSFKFINIFAMLIFIFNMTALQGVMFALPVQAAVVGKPHGVVVDNPPNDQSSELYPDLAVDKKIVKETKEGLVYQIIASNNGDAPALAVELVDQLPAGFAIKKIVGPDPYSQEGQTLVWRIDIIKAGVSIKIAIVGHFDESKLKKCINRKNSAQIYDRQYLPKIDDDDSINLPLPEQDKTKEDNKASATTEYDYGCGSLKITKVVEGGEALPQDFGFRIVGWEGKYTPPAKGQDYVVFDNLNPGKYSVEENSKVENYVQSSNGCENIKVIGGEQSECTMTNTYQEPVPEPETATVSGYKFEDLNGDGVWDEGEPPLNGWTICQEKSNPNYVDHIVTLTNTVFQIDIGPPVPYNPDVECVVTGDGVSPNGDLWPDGYYEFIHTSPAEVTITEVQQDGWTQTAPATAQHDLTVMPPAEYTGNNFGNQHLTPGLTLTKTITSSDLAPGGSIVYKLTYKNTGNVDLTNVKIEDDYPQQYVTVTDAPGAVDNGDILTWSVGNLAAGISDTLSYTVTINADTPELTDIENIATATSDQTEPANDDAVTQVPEIPVDEPGPPEKLPTIGLIKSVSADTITAGDNLTYTLDWSVNGNADATNVTITDILPQNTTFVSADNGGVYDSNVNTIIWNLGTKSPGDSGTVSMTVTTDELLPEGATITNTGAMDCNETGPVTDEARTNVTVATPNAPILQITKDVDVDTANPDGTVTYTVVVTNVGSDTAINTVVDDVLPTGFTFVDGGGTTKTFPFGDIAVGDSASHSYNVSVDASAGAGTYTNTATAKADNHGPVSDTADVEVKLPVVLGEETNPELDITKEVNVDFANPGDTVEYTVNVSNIGDGDAVNVVLTDQLPKNFTFTDSTDAVKAWQLGDFSPKDTKTITYSVKIADTTIAGNYENLAIANADNANEKQAKAPLEVREPAVLGALEETGTSLLDYIYYLLGIGILTLGLSFYLKKARKAEKAK